MSDVPPPPPGSQPPPPPPGNLAPPPGYVAYGAAPTPLGKVSRVKGLGTAITIVVAIAGLGGIINTLLQTSLISKADDFLAGTISEQEFNDSVVSLSAFSAVSGVALIAGAVLVMIWMYRITSNLRVFGHRTTWHPLFAVFGWFLPPMVLYVIPFLMLREQWKLSAAAPGAASTARTGENPTLWVWFAAFGLLPLISLSVQLDSFGSGFGDTSARSVAQNLQDLSTTITWISAIGGVVAAVAWILFVRQQTARHMAMTGER